MSSSQSMDQEETYQVKIEEKLSDRWWRINNLYWIIDEKGQKVLFRLNYVQQVIYRTLWYLNIVLKSRQHGVTTFFCIFFLDNCLFNSNVRAGVIAHNREDAETFFRDKVKYAYDALPDWIRETVPASQDTARELRFANNSSIRVGTAFVSATLQYLHISEFGKICRKFPDKATEIMAGSLNTVHAGQFITIESTAEGNEGFFYELCQDAKKKKEGRVVLSDLDFKFFFFAWYQDARNRLDVSGLVLPRPLVVYFQMLVEKHDIKLDEGQRAWYAKKWSILGEDLMHQQHPSFPEESFQASLEGAYFAPQFKRVYIEQRIAVFPREEGIPVETYWDLGMDDITAIWFAQTVSKEVRLIDYYQNGGEGLAHYVDVLRDKGYPYGRHVAPHDIKVRELGTGKSRWEVAKNLGLDFEICVRLGKQDQIEAARKFFQYCWFHEVNCSEGVRGLENYRKEWDDSAGTYKNKPFHNWASNSADAFQVMSVSHTFRAFSGGFTPNRSSNRVVANGRRR